MPELKSINGKTKSLARARTYLEGADGERALAHDLINLCEDMGGLGWDRQMDLMREVSGNNSDNRGRSARTYMHYVISPDPRDRATLAQVRGLATAWAERFFGDYQVAIVYHDDNEAHITHAHVIVNNTNLADGHRLSSDLTRGKVKLLNNALQTMALGRGMSAFAEDHSSMSEGEMAEFGRNVSREGGDPEWGDHDVPGRKPTYVIPRPSADRRQRRRDKAQRGMEGRGARSWKGEICDCVDVARRLSVNESDFRRVLSAMGVGVSVSRGGDFLYTHPMGGGRSVRGSRLGTVYSRSSVESGFAMSYARWVQRARANGSAPVPRLTEAQADRIARSVSVVGTARRGRVTARDVCRMLDYNARHRVSSYSGYAKDAKGARMLAVAREIGVFDASTERRGERVARDAGLVGRWIQEERAATGRGGGELGAPARSRAVDGRGGGEDGPGEASRVRAGRSR